MYPIRNAPGFVSNFALYSADKKDKDLKRLQKDGGEYSVNRSAAGCFNMMVGQTVCKSMLDLILHGGQKNNAQETFTQYLCEGGLRHDTLSKGFHMPYLAMNGTMIAVNVVKGASFKPFQLQHMRKPEVFNAMIAAKGRCKSAMIRLDHVNFFSHTPKKSWKVRPTVSSKLITVFRKTLSGVEARENPEQLIRYMISIGGERAFDPLSPGGERRLSALLRKVDFA